LYTKQELEKDGCIVMQSDDAREILDADVIIPFMRMIDYDLLQRAPNLKLIMQYGVGLEGVDTVSATKKNVWVCLIPGADVGNAQSCAEHAIYLPLSVFRDQNAMKESISSRLLGVPTGRTLMVRVIYEIQR
jgi:lactate dehydrogenase-like 2-hydroxyacid dehydrogenase